MREQNIDEGRVQRRIIKKQKKRRAMVMSQRVMNLVMSRMEREKVRKHQMERRKLHNK